MISGIILNWKILSSQTSCIWGPRRRGQGKIYEKIIAEKFSNEMIILNTDQEAVQTTSKINIKKIISCHIITKLRNTSDKEKIIKVPEEKMFHPQNQQE